MNNHAEAIGTVPGAMKKNYSRKELMLRVIWSFVEIVVFRYSPRLCYGWRNFVLRLLGAKIKRGVKIYPTARIMYPWLLEIGNNATISWDVKIYNLGRIQIGDNTMISQYVHLCGGTHDYVSGRFELLRTGLTVGKNVWIASDAFVGPNVVVNDGSIVAARSVVVGNVESGTLVAGNPAKVIKRNIKAYNHAM